MGMADLHAHTCHDAWCDGNQTIEDLFRFVEEETDLDLFGLTDHDNPDTARAAWAIYSRGSYRFGFIPGIEVTNQAGHLLCYFPDGNVTEIPSLRPFWSTVRYAHERGAVCIPAHPVYPPWLASTIERGLKRGQRIDAIEVINGGIAEAPQEKLDAIGRSFAGRIALVGNSDAHDRAAIGSAYTLFPGRTVDDYLQALRDCTTRPVLVQRVALKGDARRFTTRRSMTRPGWVRNLWRELRA
jgi:predicted metal-dependent phosphoesterase TrpH